MPLRTISSDNTERSQPHREVEKWLNQLSLSYLSEQEFPPYKVDIYLPEWHLALEIDGPYHSKARDEKRDKYLFEQYGLIIHRINYMAKREQVKESVLKFIVENVPDPESVILRKNKWLQIQP